jgi:hypothetical protein
MTTDHRNENLRRKSFAGRSLQAASFDGADLRGADFTMADLSNASFRSARFGVPSSIGAAILGAAIALSLAFGVVAGFAFDAVRDRLYGEGWERTSSAAGILIILLVFVVVLFWKGLDVAIRTYLWTFAVVLGASFVIRLIWGSVDIAVAARGIGLALVIALAVLSGIVARVVGGALGAWAIALVAIIGGLAAGQANGGAATLVISVSMVLISKRALHGDPRDRSVRVLAHRLVDRWGTQFVRANLTGADFTGTDATHCDVTGATLDGVQWEPGHAPIASTNPVTSPDTS